MRHIRKGPRNQQLSDEEMQRTQVLNLQDFKATARIERLSSKKPAILSASIGVLLIVLGLMFPTMQSLTTRQKTQARKLDIDQQTEKKVKVVEEDMVCHWQSLNKENGTDENIDVTFHFVDDKLVKAEKDYILTKSDSVQDTPAELGSYLNALQSFLMQISGYSVTVQSVDNGSITTTKVDYTLIDMTKVPAQHQSNYRFMVTQEKDKTKDEVETSMTAAGYKCE